MRYERRPWGWFLTLVHFEKFWIKIIRVLPFQETSVQYHHYRSELHIGTNGARYVPRHARHSLLSGFYLELAWGTHVAEADIIRIEDMYGRA